MKTMYRIDIHNYTDMTMGRGTMWVEGKTYYNTIEEAEANHKIEKNFVSNGSYKAIARTIDEETFSVADIEVKYFDYWNEVGRKESAAKWVEILTAKIDKLEKSKARVRTEAGMARKEKEIAEAKAELEKYEKVLAE